TEDFRIGEAGRGEAIAAEGGLQQRPVEHVLITAKPGTGELDVAAAASAAADISARMGKQIGRRLVIGEATVKTHLLRIFAKLDVSDRTRAVIVALERGLLARS
ncbi:response regulator transcription factor, partial [Streptomyces pilosus]|uniref:response regulator transcription factor n=1 Tax=Streptomyces pilosus TaxID=28893 RepID=UPI00368865E0